METKEIKFHNGNQIIPFKDRELNLEKPVKVFRNLSRKFKGEKVYSIMQGGRTVAHARALMLRDATFHVNENGRQFVITNKKKIVHATVKGFITDSGMGTDATRMVERKEHLPAIITYNPYTDTHFMCKNLRVDPKPITGASVVAFNSMGVSAAYTTNL
jgi:hypothetical protein